MSKCHENCVGKQACVQLIRNAEVSAAEKAKADKLELLEDVIDMLNKEAVDNNCEGIYRWNVPLQVAADELELMKQRIEAE